VIILGHSLIPFKPLKRVIKIEDIKKTEPNCTILIDFDDKELLQYSSTQDISLAIYVKNLKDACLANALGAKFILVNEGLSKKVQNTATEYLFDAKIILQVKDENDIEKAAENAIDGVIFKEGIV